ncbi:MAG: oligosaccharide flippase family protein, partial [Bacteroidetes bacterium]|nr:oligosaccharide flippase family protein [Bacteroidota bacterium]
MITDKNYSLSTQSAYVFLGKFSSFVIAFIVPIILVRLFNQAEYGVYQQMLLISMFFVEITKWGTINSLFYFYPLEKEKRTQLLSQTFYFLVIVGIICLPIIYLLRFLIADLFSSNVIIKLMLPVCLYFFFMLTSLMLDNIFILEKKSKLVFSYEIIREGDDVILSVNLEDYP